MVVVLLIMPICVMLGAIMFTNVLAEKQNLRYERDRGQSFYLTELGLNAGYYSFSESTFTSFTHLKDNDETDPNEAGTAVTGTASLVVAESITDRIPFTRAGDGWYEYSWDDSSAHNSLTGTGENERIRFRVSRTYDGTILGSSRATCWEVVCEATLGATTKTHRLAGTFEGLEKNAIFDAGDLNEFIRGANQVITGKVHANGDIFLKPSGTLLSIITETPDDGFTAGGNIWWGVDVTGRTNMGTVRINDTGPLTGADNWPANFDSRSANWLTQAPMLWGNMVKDQKLGAKVKGVPPVKSFEPDGFYANKAVEGGLNISEEGGNLTVGGAPIGSGPLATAVTERSFYNNCEERTVDCVQIDVSQLSADDYPNGLIYSSKPLILINAEKLPRSTSIVSQSGIYTAGDFNKELATQDDFQQRFGGGGHTADPLHTTKVSAALMTKDRIWHVSKNFSFPTSRSNSQPAADDPEEYPGDNTFVNRDTDRGNRNVIEVNGMLLDGAPNNDEVWNRVVEDVLNSEGNITGQAVVPAWGPTNPDPQNRSTSWDDFLENHGGNRVVKKRGSIIHLQNANMAGVAAFQNQNVPVPDEETAWYRRAFYTPPFRDYGYDELLRTSPPPFAPRSAEPTMWKRY